MMFYSTWYGFIGCSSVCSCSPDVFGTFPMVFFPEVSWVLGSTIPLASLGLWRGSMMELQHKEDYLILFGS